MLLFGVFGLWQDSIDLLLVTIIAVVFCFVIGLPTGILMARSRAISAFVTPVLDIMQTMPPFAYLAPVALGFGIGPTTAIVLTCIYALPPLVRITEHGIRACAGHHHRGSEVAGPDARTDAAPGPAADGTAHHRGRRQPEHDGGALDGHHRCAGQRPRARQARQRSPADPEHRRRLGGRHPDRADGDHARPHHDGGQRAVREHGPVRRRVGERPGSDARRGRARAVATLGHRGGRQGCPPATVDQGRSLAGPWALAHPDPDPRLLLPPTVDLRAVPHPRRLAVPEVHRRHHGDQAGQRLLELVHRQGRHLHAGPEERPDQLADQPAAEPARRVPLVDDGDSAPRVRLRPRRLATRRDHAGLRGDHLRHRSVERHDDHADHDDLRDRAGDADGRRPRGRDGTQPSSRYGDQTDPGRLPDDPAVRLPDPRAGPVRRQPLHRHRRGGRVRRTDRDQARRRRDQGRLPHHRGGRPGQWQHDRGR